MPIVTIAPKDIQTKTHWYETFQRSEREVSARLLVKYCQHLNPDSWPASISKKALDKWADEDFWFNGLDTEGYIKVQGDKITLTENFIATSYAKQSIKK